MQRSRPVQVFGVCLLLLAVPSAGLPAPSPEADDEQLVQAAGIGTGGPALRDFFRRRTLTPADSRQIAVDVRRLGDPSYRIRRRASTRLMARGCLAAPALRHALADPDLEMVRRAERALRHIQNQDTGPAVTAAAARLLGRKRPAGAAATLLAFLPFAENDVVAEEVVTALSALAVRRGKPEPALLAALTDPDAVKRAGAAEALCRAGPIEVRAVIRKLLRDPEPVVRMRVAMALSGSGEKAAVPVLIDLLAELSPEQAYRAQDCLCRLGEERSPSVPLGVDAAGRRRCRDAWAEWWRRYGAQTDLAQLRRKPRALGYTLLVLLDAGKVLERDSAGKQLWQIDGLELPVDVVTLPGERFLITEHGAGRVTERNRKGEVLWEKKIAQPLMAQRLPSGHTFIATRSELVEVDWVGRVVFTYAAPGGEVLMRGCRLANGDVAFVTQEPLGETRCVRLNASGKQLARFAVNVNTYGGRIEVLPNGRVLVPEMTSNRVVEYDASGRVAWQAMVEQPVAAVRLANGHTLVTTYNQQRAIELDQRGREVGEYRADTRVTRAWRR
jgi:hypothetical protein